MIKSIRWRLQIWHALMLFLTVGGFGAILDYQLKQARYDEIDGELHANARVLEGTLKVLSPRLWNGEGPPPKEFKGGRGKDFRGFRPKDFNGSGFKGKNFEDIPWGKDFERPNPKTILENSLQLPPEFIARYANNPNRTPYFCVFGPNRTLLKASITPLPSGEIHSTSERKLSEEGFQSEQLGVYRQVWLAGPNETRIMVGRSIEEELSGIHKQTWKILITSLSIILVGLLGGWFFARKAVKPIYDMGKITETISEKNLDQRISLATVDSEFAHLAEILNAMFARLESAFAQQIRFTADASHELRTPLAIILSQTEHALARNRSAESYRTALETNLRATKRMKYLVDGLITLARADTGKWDLQCEWVDLAALAQEAADQLIYLAKKQNIEIQLRNQHAVVYGDPDRLMQVLLNLITNAIHYNHPDGKIVIETGTDRKQIFFSVADTGCGIAPEHHIHLFERFYRADAARSRETGGSGLGLSICQGIVQAHHGIIRFTSMVGKGTTFTVRLPQGDLPEINEPTERIAIRNTSE